MRLRLLSGTAAAVFVITSGATAHATTPRPTYSIDQMVHMGLAQQNEILNPLRTAASAVDAAGRGPDAAFFSGVTIDPKYDGVDLYITDTTKAGQLIADAQRLAPGFDSSLVKILKATHTKKQQNASRDALAAKSKAKQLPYTVTSVVVHPEGTGLTVEVDNVDAAKTHLAAHPDVASADGVTVPVEFTQGRKATDLSWSDTKWHDSVPFIGGDVLTDGSSYCTAGLPAVRNSDNRDIMMTAGHCYNQGANVYTGGVNTGTYFYGYNNMNTSTGNWVGTEIWNQPRWDMEELDQGGYNSPRPLNNADESDVSGWIPLTSVSYSYTNDLVCHSGAVSFYMGHGTPCGIQVTNENRIIYNFCDNWGCYDRQGVEGVQYGNGWAGAQGDSGAIVWTNSGSYKQARGQVSIGIGGWTVYLNGVQPITASNDLFWTEAPDILGSGGLSLNSVT